MKENKQKVTHLPKPLYLRVALMQEHIDRGIQRNSGHCPGAYSVKDACAARGIEAKSVAVDVTTIRFTDPERKLRYIYLTPRPMQDFIVAFDQGQHLTPFNYVLHAGIVTIARGRPATEKDRQRNRKRYHRLKALKEQLKTPQIVAVKDNWRKPSIIGGPEPPIASFRRREYGIARMIK